ncbi:SGNH/GDSL hydrolase family protein [Francisella salina]|uniref:Phospholipase/lecithinase/hemolysin n=1 Tax=Francisella salina TaxID=573569 RepID=A0ABN3ZVC3_FRAST|nr:SGNH/GDSL hydrolase family protein [Francisella salina]AEI36849.1 Phospholipase/lecithinase/hemolysin [Francisella salina]
MNKKAFFTLIVCYFFCSGAFAKELKNIIIFGDSLSDSGYANNFHNIDSGWPLIPGDLKDVKQPTLTSPDKGNTVWIQFLSQDNKILSTPNNIYTPGENINRSVKPVLDGNNYAAGGATTVCKGLGNKGDYTPPPLGPLREGENCLVGQEDIQKHNQIDSYLKQHQNKADPDSIYIIWGGANNLFIQLGYFADNRSILSKIYYLMKYKVTGEVLPDHEILKVENAAEDIASDVRYLIKHGAEPRNIFVVNLPDLGITPAATENGIDAKSFKVELFNSLSRAFNEKLASNIMPDFVSIIDAQKFFNTIVKDRKIKVNGVEYNFSDVTHSACDFDGPNDLTCVPKGYVSGRYDKYLFAGQVHPTSYTHKVLSKYIYSFIIK